jgi:hypothetical protein
VGQDGENIALICTSENQNIFSDGAGQGGQISACGATVLPGRVNQYRKQSQRQSQGVARALRQFCDFKMTATQPCPNRRRAFPVVYTIDPIDPTGDNRTRLDVAEITYF